MTGNSNSLVGLKRDRLEEYRDFAYIRTDPAVADGKELHWQRRNASDLAVTRRNLKRIRQDGFTVRRGDVVTERIGAGVAASGRPKLMKLLRRLRPMTALVTWSLDELGRNPDDVIKTILLVKETGAQVYCISVWDEDLAICSRFRSILEHFAEFRAKTNGHGTIVKRAGQGVHGGRLGRPPSLNDAARAEVLAGLVDGQSIASLARKHNTSRQTILRVRDAKT